MTGLAPRALLILMTSAALGAASAQTPPPPPEPLPARPLPTEPDPGTAPVPGWAWALAAAGDQGTVSALATAPSGGAYVAGTFQRMGRLGDVMLEGDADEAFVARVGADGAVEWAVPIGGPLDDAAFAVAGDHDGVYVAGAFRGTAQFGSAQVTAVGGADAFLARLTVGGDVVWVRSVGGALDDVAAGVAADGEGGAYLVGEFRGTLSSDIPASARRASAGDADGFVARFGADGQGLWLQPIGGRGPDGAFDVASAPGGAYLVGSVTEEAQVGSAFVEGSAQGSLLAAEIDADGRVVWARTLGGEGALATGTGVAAARGGLYVVGGVNGTTDAALGETETAHSDILVAKLNDEGGTEWAWTAGGDGWDFGTDVAATADGRAYVVANFSPPEGQSGPFGLAGAGDGEAFVAALTPEGRVVWAQRAGGKRYDGAQAVAVGEGGEVYVAGHFRDYAFFGPLLLLGGSGGGGFVSRVQTAP